MNHGVGRAAGTPLFPALSVVALLLGGCARGPSPRLSFNETVQPILSEYCYGCHGPSSSSRKAGLRLDHSEFAYAPHEKFGPAIIPGRPDSSPLVKRIEAKDPEQRMPPPEARKTLRPEQIAALRQWIKEGAQYETHWAFVAPKVPPPPTPDMLSVAMNKLTENDAPHGTAFTVTVDYKHGTTTGISAEDRTATVRGLANNNAGASDFARPGHIFPLIAKEGGVLMRSGHTEAAVDLCRLANLEPVGVICELVNDDGTVMRGTQIKAFAEKHKLKQISVDDLIAYRQAREKLVERVGEFNVETSIGTLKGYGYVTPFDKVHHMALVHGRIGDGRDVLTRLHRANILRDIFGGAPEVHGALRRFAKEGRGVLVFLRDGSAGVPVSALPQDGDRGAEAARQRQWREIGLGAQILKDLGISSIRLLASADHHYVGLAGFGIEIVATEPIA